MYMYNLYHFDFKVLWVDVWWCFDNLVQALSPLPLVGRTTREAEVGVLMFYECN